jgi:hypothetical protein
MKKYLFSSVLAIAISAVFTGCSKSTDLYDEGAQQAVKEAEAQAKITEMLANYQTDFVKTFGTIAPGHKWGFDQAKIKTTTRGAVVHDPDGSWEIPADMTAFKEGDDANKVQAAFKAAYSSENPTSAACTVKLDDYWMLHIDHAHQQNGMRDLQAWDNTIKDWVDVTHFDKGMNTAHFTVIDTNNKVLHGGTLMANMDGTAGCDGTEAHGGNAAKGKYFRWKEDGKWQYDYYFLEYGGFEFLGLRHYTSAKDYTFWVILLAPANTYTEPNTQQGRVLCEDMGTKGDFDFNDLVFDAYYLDDHRIKVIVRAAGGKLKITVAGKDVHKEMGADMANTGENTAPEYEFYIDPENGDYKYATIDQIPVVVYPAEDLATSYTLEAPEGLAPQKICTYLDAPWPDEYIRIDIAYKNFNSWVQSNFAELIWIDECKWWLIDHDKSNNGDLYNDPNDVDD